MHNLDSEMGGVGPPVPQDNPVLRVEKRVVLQQAGVQEIRHYLRML